MSRSNSVTSLLISRYHRDMVRTQIQLTDEQARALRRAASDRGISMAAVIRELVDDALAFEQQARVGRALGALGRFRSGVSHVSAEHDRELEDAYRA